MMNAEAEVYKGRPTLFPYIQSGQSGIRIDFLSGAQSRDGNKPAFPFETLDHPDPLTRLVKARLVTDAGSVIENLLVLLQKDEVVPVENLSLPKTNPGISHHWQMAFKNFSENEAFRECLIRLGGQLSDDGRLRSFQPLLYCSYRKAFFPPPCPICGGLLDLCRDDDMLASNGLHAYSRSARRYLFCPTCYQLAGETDFYSSLDADRLEENVKGFPQWTGELKKLASSATPTHRFPCRSCTEKNDCHARNGPVSSRILPFAFYPFYMLIFKAASVNVSNLLLSTATENNFAYYPKNEEDLSRPDQNQSIVVILQRLVAKWQTEAEKYRETQVPADVVPKTFQQKQQAPLSETAVHSTMPDFDPDLQVTRIVCVDKTGPLSGSDPGVAGDQDFPETIILKARQPGKPETVQADAVRRGHQLNDAPSSDMPREGTGQTSRDMLPETVIVHPEKGSPLKPRHIPNSLKSQTESLRNRPEDHQETGRSGMEDPLDETIVVQPKKTEMEK